MTQHIDLSFVGRATVHDGPVGTHGERGVASGDMERNTRWPVNLRCSSFRRGRGVFSLQGPLIERKEWLPSGRTRGRKGDRARKRAGRNVWFARVGAVAFLLMKL